MTATMKKRNTAISATLALAMAMMLMSGCAGNGNFSGNGTGENNNYDAKAAAPQKEQGSVTLDTNNGDVIISSIAEKPATFPDEIPLPANAAIVAAMEQVDIGSTMVAFDVNEPYENVVQLYRDYVASSGYTEVMPVTDEPESYWFAGSRGAEQLGVIVNKDLERDGRSSGMLTYKHQP